MNKNRVISWKYLEYPEELHDTRDTFPCAPEKVSIEKDMLSNYQKELGDCGIALQLDAKQLYKLTP